VQIASVPRLLTSAGQGYGYAVAWSLAQLLQPALLQHVHEALAVAQQQQSGAAAGAAGHYSNNGSGCSEHVDAGKIMWRQFFSQGGSLANAVELVRWVAVLQEHAGVAGGSGGSDSSRLKRVADALQEQGMWPLVADLHNGGADEQQGIDYSQAAAAAAGEEEALPQWHPLDVLAVCLGCALARLHCELAA
jgi:hypothetical protein